MLIKKMDGLAESWNTNNGHPSVFAGPLLLSFSMDILWRAPGPKKNWILEWLNLHYIHPVVHQIKVYQGVPCSMPRGVNQILGTVKHVLRVSSIMSAGDMDKV